MDSARVLVGGDQGRDGRRMLNPLVIMPLLSRAPRWGQCVSVLTHLFQTAIVKQCGPPISLCTKGCHQSPTV